MSQNHLPQLGNDGKILEGIVTTLDGNGEVNISPMGPIVDATCSTFIFRPFQTSSTYRNLVDHREGVFHVTDDVSLIATSAVGRPSPLPLLQEAHTLAGMVLAEACRWYEFRIESIDDREERAVLVGRTVHEGRNRDFFGFNRAQHAVLEAAILATRVSIIPSDELASELKRLAVIVKKTASHRELSAFAFLQEYIESSPQADQRACIE